jgi:hypothetical protein
MSMKLHRVTTLVLAFIAVELFFGLMAWTERSDTNDPPCPKGTTEQSTRSAEPVQLKLVENQDPTLRMGRELGRREKEISFDVEGTPFSSKQELVVELSNFERQDGGQIDREDITAHATANGDSVDLVFCLNRPSIRSEDPGLYKGTIRIADPRVAETAVTATVQLAYPSPFLVAASVLAACAAGVAWIWWLGQSLTSQEPTWRDFETWLFSVRAAFAIAVGLVGAAGAWLATYETDPTWGANVAQWATLIGVCFTAFTTSSATITGLWHTPQRDAKSGTATDGK